MSMSPDEKRIMEEQRLMKEKNRALRNERIRKMLAEGLPCSVIRERAGLTNKKYGISELRKLAGEP